MVTITVRRAACVAVVWVEKPPVRREERGRGVVGEDETDRAAVASDGHGVPEPAEPSSSSRPAAALLHREPVGAADAGDDVANDETRVGRGALEWVVGEDGVGVVDSSAVVSGVVEPATTYRL
jgi:hypothetical protein